MKHAILAVLTVSTLLTSTNAQAQHRGDVGLTVTVGRHFSPRAILDDATGALLDVLAAGRVRSMARGSIVAAGGVGVVMGGTVDDCQLRPDGTCAPKANFFIVDALAGAAMPVGQLTVRALAGPTLYSGADDTSLGVQGRLDLNAPMSTHVGLGAMLRATVLPSHGGEQLTLWAVGGSLTFR
ncbi:MAG: hypothetical protein ACYC7F_07380 [Gemmatimonadaceae bacterium]